MNSDIETILNDQHEISTDRLHASMQGEWSGMISFNGLLVASAAISSAVGDPELKFLRFSLVTCSLLSTLFVMMNASAVRQTHQEIYDIHPDNPQGFEKAKELLQKKTVRNRRIWMRRRFSAAKFLMFLSGIMTLYMIWY